MTTDRRQAADRSGPEHHSLDTTFFPSANERDSDRLDSPASTPETSLPRWLSVEQIRKMQRMRRETVLDAMLSGELPFEQRGRIRYARLTDVFAWEERRLARDEEPVRGLVHPDLADLA